MIGRYVNVFTTTALMVALSAPVVGAQQSVRIQVRDDRGVPVGFALVGLVGGASRVASDSGVIELRMRAADSLNINAKRIGYREHVGWVKRGAGDLYVVRMEPLVQTVSAVEVRATGGSSNTPLVQRGFYDRVDRVQKGAILADFFTPEQLDQRAFNKVTDMIAGSRYARLGYLATENYRVAVIQGRGGCPMTILLDGDVVRGTAQDVARAETPVSINPTGTRQQPSEVNSKPPSIDEVVDGRSIMAIEVYPSTANAPVELQRTAGRGSCGIVALWTGGRR